MHRRRWRILGAPELVATPQTALAVVVGLIAAIAYGAAAVLQHQAIRGANVPDTGQPAGQREDLSLRQMLGLLSLPRWRAGLSFMVGGTVLHVIALALAPLTIIQPIGVLAVPAAVVLAAGYAHRGVSRRVIGGVVICAVGVVGFVLLAAPGASAGAVDARPMLIATVVVVAASGLLSLLSRLPWPTWVRCLLLASASAFTFGLASAVTRDLTQIFTDGRFTAHLAAHLGLVAALIVAAALGGWFIQQAYNAGAAPVVTACGTVVDPVVAVLLGITVLAEGVPAGPGHVVGMILSALVAASGVVILARFHPDSEAVLPVVVLDETPTAAETDWPDTRPRGADERFEV